MWESVHRTQRADRALSRAERLWRTGEHDEAICVLNEAAMLAKRVDQVVVVARMWAQVTESLDHRARLRWIEAQVIRQSDPAAADRAAREAAKLAGEASNTELLGTILATVV